MKKRVTNYIIFMLLLLAVIWLFRQKDWLSSFGGIFKSSAPEIENTAIVIKEINALSQLVTITSYNEVVMEDVIKGNAIFNNPIIPTVLNIPDLRYADKKLVLIGKGRVLAGINLARLSDKDLFIKGDSIAVILPKAEILQVILNPTDFDTFEETGTWTDEEVRLVKIRLRDKLVATVIQQNILQKAATKATLVMENFIGSLGFRKVTITFAP